MINAKKMLQNDSPRWVTSSMHGEVTHSFAPLIIMSE